MYQHVKEVRIAPSWTTAATSALAWPQFNKSITGYKFADEGGRCPWPDQNEEDYNVELER